MPNIITRYLTGEIIRSSAATVLILFVILMSNALGRVLSDIADGDVPQQALIPVLLSQSVNVFSLLLPVGFFLGIVFAFGRLYKDHEIVVMNACGMGYRQFYRPVIIILIPLLVFSAYANLWLNAQMQRNAQEIVEREKDVHEFDQLRVGQFNQSNDGEDVFYMESISDDRLVLNKIIISQNREDHSVFETAQQGRHRFDDNSGDLFLVIGPGERYEGIPGGSDYRIIEFEQHGILLEKKKNTGKRQLDVEEKTPEQLWNSEQLRDQVELQWRISISVIMVVLAILAVPLSYIAPRQGRYGKVAYAFLVFLIYINLMAFSRAQIEAKVIPLAINFWWIHAVFIIMSILLLARRNRILVWARKGISR